MAKPPSYTCCNESILPGLSDCGISRRLWVHDPRHLTDHAPDIPCKQAAVDMQHEREGGRKRLYVSDQLRLAREYRPQLPEAHRGGVAALQGDTDVDSPIIRHLAPRIRQWPIGGDHFSERGDRQGLLP